MPSKDEMLNPDDRDFVTALASGLEVILAFDQQSPRMTLSEVAANVTMAVAFTTAPNPAGVGVR